MPRLKHKLRSLFSWSKDHRAAAKSVDSSALSSSNDVRLQISGDNSGAAAGRVAQETSSKSNARTVLPVPSAAHRFQTFEEPSFHVHSQGSGLSDTTAAPAANVAGDETYLRHVGGVHSDGAGVLVEKLRSGPVASRAAAAELLFNSAAEDMTVREEVSSMGVVFPLVGLVAGGDRKGQMYAAYTLSALASIEQALDDMRSCNAIAALLQLLGANGELGPVKGAARALSRLSRVNECAVTMVSQGALPLLVSLLAADDALLVRRCLITLYFIGADKPEMQSRIADASGVPIVLALCKSHEEDVQSEATDVVKVLARSRVCALEIIGNDGVTILEDVARNAIQTKARICAKKALQRLAEVDGVEPIMHDIADDLLEANAVGSCAHVVAALWDDNADTQIQGMQAVNELVKEDSAASTALAHAGAVEALVAAMRSGTQAKRGQAAAVLALITGALDVRKRMWAAGAVPELVAGLTDLSPQGTEGACLCLQRLTSLQPAAEQMVGEPVVAGLLHVAATGTEHGKAAALVTLYRLSGVDPRAMTQAAHRAGIARIVAAGWDCTPDVQGLVMLLLRELARGHLDALVDMRTEVVPLVACLCDSPIADVATRARDARKAAEAARPVADEFDLQAQVSPLLDAVADTSSADALPRTAERALRMLPRGLYLPQAAENDVYDDREVAVLPNARVERPGIDVLMLQKLKLRRGQRFLEIGAGSGYLCCLAACVVGPTGAVSGADVSAEATAYARDAAAAVHSAGRLGLDTPCPAFLHQDGAALLKGASSWNAIVVSGGVGLSAVRSLLALLAPRGRLIACVEGRLRLFEQGRSAESAAIIAAYDLAPMTLGLAAVPGGDASKGSARSPAGALALTRKKTAGGKIVQIKHAVGAGRKAKGSVTPPASSAAMLAPRLGLELLDAPKGAAV